MHLAYRATALSLCFLPLTCLAEQTADTESYFDHYYLQGGTYTHYHHSPEHAGPNILVSLEGVKKNDWLYGLSLFDNSFNQFTQYIYTGKIWNYHDALEGFHTKVTAGLIHGYHGKYRDKIPFNRYEIAPAIIPSVGYDNGKYGADVIMLGVSGLLFTVGMHL